MNILKTTPKGWATDDILVPNIMESLDTTDGTDFVCTISVQGHGDYPTEPTLENPEINVTGVEDEGKRNAWEYYVNEVHEMDKFVGQLIDAIEQRGEPTVIVFYGDHLPTLGLEAKDLKGKYLYNTNYVIWDNIGLEKKDGKSLLTRLWQKSLIVWIFIQELFSITISREDRQRIILLIWNYSSMISCTENSMYTRTVELRSQKDIWSWG